MKFFSPTSELKELLLLEHIEKNPDTTQKEVAKIISGATSMVNVYIDNLEEKNYLYRDYKSVKTVYYIITPEGIKRKNYLAITYLQELLELYKLAEESVKNFLIGLENKGYRNILLYGAGEVAETILGTIKGRVDKPLNALAIIDDDIDRRGKQLLGYNIISREDISKYEHDGIVITSYTFEDDITSRLNEIRYPEDRVERFFTI